MKRKVMLIGFCLTLLAMGLPQDVGAQGHGRVIKMEIKEERLTDALSSTSKKCRVIRSFSLMTT